MGANDSHKEGIAGGVEIREGTKLTIGHPSGALVWIMESVKQKSQANKI